MVKGEIVDHPRKTFVVGRGEGGTKMQMKVPISYGDSDMRWEGVQME